MMMNMVAKREFKLCRLCLCTGQKLTDIFSGIPTLEFSVEETIQDLLAFTAVRNRNFPWLVCSTCMGKLTEFRLFKQQCLECKTAFESRFLGVESRVEEEEVGNAKGSDNKSLRDALMQTDGEVMRHKSPMFEAPLDIPPHCAVPFEEEATAEDYECLKSEIPAENVVEFRREVPLMENVEPQSSPPCDEEAMTEGYEYLETESADKNVIECRPEVRWMEKVDPLSTQPCDVTIMEGNQIKEEEEVLTIEGDNISCENECPGNMDDTALDKGGDCDMNGYIPRRMTPYASNDKKKFEWKGYDFHRKDFICDHCGIKFFDKNQLYIHIKGHKFENCPSKTLNLVDPFHMYSTSRIGKCLMSYKCDICGKVFKFKSTLVLHLRTHGLNDPFKCETCGKTFKYSSNLVTHLKKHFGLKNCKFKCEICGKMYSSKRSLRKHTLDHRDLKPFKCQSCGKEFSQKRTLLAHYIVHSGVKAFKCEICGREFARKGCLKIHSVIHDKVKPFMCDICGMGFNRRNALSTHSAVHSGVKNFKCGDCGKKFVRKSHLQTHAVIHGNLKPYKCDICGKGFTQKSSLVTHSIVHSGIKAFKCETCGKEFFHRHHLKRHSSLHTRVAP